ncbi:hypothetical protein [Azoarcus sp. KH32C]|uniref:hypothetical protein n=1 Tax=Azoarcus sp. KH32C TaxID=748247 RepID=UPI000238641A|nr:hypothetical protein [Azoarcus sp. KH32C]BAL25737.1 hypothetical protein AZKH_3448 [Azoarcus sp. KH32C]
MHSLKLIALLVTGALSAPVAAQSFLPLAFPLHAQAAASGHFDLSITHDTSVGLQWGRTPKHGSGPAAVSGAPISFGGGQPRSAAAWASHQVSENWMVGAQYCVPLAATVTVSGVSPTIDVVRNGSFAFGVVGRNTLVENDRLAITISRPVPGTPSTGALFDGLTPVVADAISLRVGLDYGIPLSRASSLTWVLDLNHRSPQQPTETDSRAAVILRVHF